MSRASLSVRNRRARLQVEVLEARTVPADILYANGAWVTGAGDGFQGGNTSAVIPPEEAFGFSQRDDIFHIADDFTVDGTGWYVYGFLLTGYQTGNMTTTSTFTEIYLRLWQGVPGSGGIEIVPRSGDVLNEEGGYTFWSTVYRVTLTTLRDNNRAIMFNYADALAWSGFPVYLPPGTYWLEWSAVTTGGTGVNVWQNLTINNAGPDENALQFSVGSGMWRPMPDPPGDNRAVPFYVVGERSNGPVPGSGGIGSYVFEGLAGQGTSVAPVEQTVAETPAPQAAALEQVLGGTTEEAPLPAPTARAVAKVFQASPFQLDFAL